MKYVLTIVAMSAVLSSAALAQGKPPAAAKSAIKLKKIAVALHVYAEVNKNLPPAVIRDKTGKPLYS